MKRPFNDPFTKRLPIMRPPLSISPIFVPAKLAARTIRSRNTSLTPFEINNKACVYRLAEAIITIVWHLSLVYLDAEIHPLRTGLEIFVDNWSLSSGRGNVTNIGDITPLLASLQLDITLQTVELLFAGNLLHLWNRAQRPVNGNLTMGPPMKGPARCSYGICLLWAP